MTWTLHPCPYCQCEHRPEGPPVVNTAAPFYALVVAIDALLWAETTAKHRAARRRRKDAAR